MPRLNRFRLSLGLIEYFDRDGELYHSNNLAEQPPFTEWYDTDVTLSGVCNAISKLLNTDSESISINNLQLRRGYGMVLTEHVPKYSILAEGSRIEYHFKVDELKSINLGEKLHDSLSKKL